MPVLPLLLRILLSLSLILNGSGYAVAATHMQMGQAGTAALAPEQEADPVEAAEPPCTQHQNGASGLAAQLTDAISGTASVKSEPTSADCCKSGACRCACVHQAQVAIPAYFPGSLVIEHAGVMYPPKPGHAAPALPHLIRPPIG